MVEAPHPNSFAAKSYRDRILDLQDKLNNPQTGEYVNRDHWKLKKLPYLNREIIELYYGVRGREPRTQKQIAQEIGIKVSLVSQTIKESFELLALIEELSNDREQMRREYSDKRSTLLNDKDRRNVSMARSACERMLQADKEARENSSHISMLEGE